MAEATQLRVRLVTPERTLFEQNATSVELPSKSGNLEVLYGAAPLLAELGAGDVLLHGAQSNERYFVNWGFVEVLPDRVTILADGALKPAEIDTERAKEQLVRGQKLWSEAGDDARLFAEANRVQREAEAKIASASKA